MDTVQDRSCRSLWIAIVQAQLTDACGMHFRLPKNIHLPIGNEGVIPPISYQFEKLCEKYTTAQDLYDKAFNIKPCAYHKAKAKRLSENDQKPIKHKPCGKCLYCVCDQLYRWPVRTTSVATQQARYWLETDRFDHAMTFAGLEGRHIDEGFAMIQEVISAEKYLHDTYGHQAHLRSRLVLMRNKDYTKWAGKSKGQTELELEV